MTAILPEPAFLDLLRDQIAAAQDAAVANDLIGQEDLADWWRWRAEDLGRYLSDGQDPADGSGGGTAGTDRADRTPLIGGSMGHDTETHAA